MNSSRFSVAPVWSRALAAAAVLAVSAFASRHAAVAAEAAAIPLDELGARVTASYQGDALGVQATATGARLHTGFQKLAGVVDAEGLWLESTSEKGGRLHLRARAWGRSESVLQPLAPRGQVVIGAQSVLLRRAGVSEEFSVSVDGVRQDFHVAARPGGRGALVVALAVAGATAEAAEFGARLVLRESGRALAYSRLRVTDATGRVLPARLEVRATDELAVLVDDAGAQYPVCIDPTFSDADWISLNSSVPGVAGTVNALAVDGSGNVYVGGSFSVAGSSAIRNIARWNGSAWSALGSGVDNAVSAIAISGTDVYVGGQFLNAGGAPANRVAKWNGSTWSSLGSGVDGRVRTLLFIGAALYVGGDFNNAGGIAAAKIAVWNGSNWAALGNGVTLGSGIYALANIGSVLYAGGDAIFIDGVRSNFIGRWNGSAWSRLGSGSATPGSGDVGVSNSVFALTVVGTDLYVGGGFGRANGGGAASVLASFIAKYNSVTNTWSALAAGTNAAVMALTTSGGFVYAGGGFTTAGGGNAPGVAVWNGSSWANLGTGIENSLVGQDTYVNALVATGGSIYAGGSLRRAGGIPTANIARWTGSAWAALTTSGLGNSVEATLVVGSDLYVGGSFISAGSVTANRIARWNGTSWSALGTGLDNTVTALAASGTDLYAGGKFTTAGGVAANRVARWNGSAWSALGTGVASGVCGTENVLALAANGADVYVGGCFASAGGVTSTQNIARWNGSAWVSLGSASGTVRALQFAGGNLYAAGSFFMVGSTSASNIARWNGSAWSALGSGLDSQAQALAVSGSNVYAGGYFTTAGGVSANRVARWDGSAWSALGTGVNDFVTAIAVSGSNVYVGGNFTSAGGNAAQRIAHWNGSSWSPLGSGVDGPVAALATDASNHLFVGGSFSFVGANTISPFIAQANLPPSAPDIAVSQAGALTDGVSTVDFGLVNAGQSGSARTFTITNPGTADLTSLVVSKDGANAADFTVSSLSGTTVPVGAGSVTFTVTFSPGSAGPKSAALHIASNVVGAANPFDIALTGSAGSAPTFLSAATTVFTVGSNGSFVVQASASPAPSLALTSGALPAGVSFTAGTGVLTGVPAAGTGGSYPLVFTASNGAPPDATQNFVLVVNRPPLAGADTLDTVRNTPVSFPASRLLLNDSDADGDPLTLQSVAAASAQGGSVAVSSGVLTYTPPVGFSGADSFSYTMADGRGGFGSGTVAVNVAATGSSAQNLVGIELQPGVGARVRWQGIVGRGYLIEYTDDLGANWNAFPGSVTADGVGVIEYVDTTQPPPTQRFYRTAIAP
ncbi:MAG: choice-of-anchor D domain-containing protein [Verrucomicrobia bacterium]|nr:choice-of-anchor D domain-containing protein [Verrucomicrobiota bacterium]